MENKVYDGLFRLCKDSYSLWPENAALPASEVAEAGFVYERVQDFVRCPVCRIRLFEWMPTSDPLHEHEHFSKGKCKFLDYIKTRETSADCDRNNKDYCPEKNTIKLRSTEEADKLLLSPCVQCQDVEPVDSSERATQPPQAVEERDMDRLVSDYLDRPELVGLLKRGANRKLLSENIRQRLLRRFDILSNIASITRQVMVRPTQKN